MLLYDPRLDMRLPDYGIQIPIRDRRAPAVLEYLRQSHPNRGPHILNLQAAEDLLDIPPAVRGIGRADLERVHSREYVAALLGDGLEAELVKTYELIDERGEPRRYRPDLASRPLTELFSVIQTQVWGTYLACRLALAQVDRGPSGFAYYLGGGMHHARYDAGSGFCLLNDSMIAARRLQAEGLVSSIWVIDLDAHKGDGTAELASKDPSILTLSIHMASGWPLDPETLAQAVPGRAPLVPSDVELPVSRYDQTSYISILASGLTQLEALSSGALPELALVVDGADPYEKDELPSTADLQLSLETCVERDRAVYRFLRERNIPSAWLMAGGYGDRAWEPPAHFLDTLLATDGDPDGQRRT